MKKKMYLGLFELWMTKVDIIISKIQVTITNIVNPDMHANFVGKDTKIHETAKQVSWAVKA